MGKRDNRIQQALKIIFGKKSSVPMARKRALLFAAGIPGCLVAIGLILIFSVGRMMAEPPVPADPLAGGVDVTGQFKALNDEKTGKIPDQFRKGNVAVKAGDPIVKKTATGFEVQLGQTNVPSPVVYDGKVYVSGGFGSREYYAFDARTGRKIWSVSLDDDGPSAAAIVDNVVVFNTESCTVFACRADTGAELWSYWLGDPLMSMPTVANGIVFTAYPSPQGQSVQADGPAVKPDPTASPKGGAGQAATAIRGTHVLIAIALHSGKILWQRWIDGDVMSAPVADGGDLYVSTFSGTLIKFKQATGEILSAKSIRATSAPVIRNGEIMVSRRSDRDGEKAHESMANYAAANMNQTKEYNKKAAPYLDGKVQANSALKSSAMAYDAGNGFSGGAPASSGWENANAVVGQSNVSSLQSFQGSRILSHRGFNYNTMGDELIRTDAKTGAVNWKLKLDGDLEREGGFIGAPPLMAGNKVVLAGYNGELSVRDPETGKVLQKFKVNDHLRYQPVVEKGWIYATTVSGKLVAVNTGDITLSGWPMWGANPARTNQAE